MLFQDPAIRNNGGDRQDNQWEGDLQTGSLERELSVAVMCFVGKRVSALTSYASIIQIDDRSGQDRANASGNTKRSGCFIRKRDPLVLVNGHSRTYFAGLDIRSTYMKHNPILNELRPYRTPKRFAVVVITAILTENIRPM